MRDVNNGWLIRYFHSNTASAFFFLVTITIANFFFCVSILLFSLHILSSDESSIIINEQDRTSTSKLMDSFSHEDFSEWFRGFIDAEGNFFIQIIENRFKLVFTLCLHKDEFPLLKYIAKRLGVGNLYVREKTAIYTISSKYDLLKVFSILDKQSLNTSKNLNYVLFRQAYDLYFNRESIKVSFELRENMVNLKNQMNKKRWDFSQPPKHTINITRYWLLGFIEGNGYFSVNRSDYSLKFGIGQIYQERCVLEAIQTFILDLPGEYVAKRNKTSPVVKLATYNQGKDG